jgi:hypothetical protein
MKNKNFKLKINIAIITSIIAISILLSQMSWSLLGFFNFILILSLIGLIIETFQEYKELKTHCFFEASETEKIEDNIISLILLNAIFIFIGLWEIFSFKIAIILYIIIPIISYITYIIYKIIKKRNKIKKQREMEKKIQKNNEERLKLWEKEEKEMEQMRQKQLKKFQQQMEQMRQKQLKKFQQQIEKLKNTKIIIDSNIYMNDKYNELFDFFIKYQIQILMTPLQYDEIKNIKKSDKDEKTKYAARNAMRIITKLSKKKVLKIINKNFESNEKAYADPEIFKYARNFAKKHPVLVVTNDMDLINNLIHIPNNPNIEVFDGDDFEKLIKELKFSSYF